MKSNKKNILFATLSLLAMLSTSCGGGGTVSGDTTINVKLYLGGYGSSWMSSLIEKFETAFADKGYKVNLLKPSKNNTGSTIINELASGYNKNQIDLYFTASIAPSKVVAGDYGLLVSDLSSVYASKPLTFEGKEESKTIQEKLDPSFDEEWYRYDGKSYNFLYEKSVGGLVVNKDKLTSYGLELPVTTDEFLNCIHTIHQAYAAGTKKIQPLTLIGSGTNGYPSVMMNSWFTQYSGIEGWNRFWSMNKDDGTADKENGYQVFEDAGLHKAAELLYAVYDQQNMVKGAASNELDTAHDDIMYENRGAVFMFDGDWMLNECAVDYSKDELSKLAFINVPVTSDLGIKLWGETYDEAACETILAKTIRLCDAGNAPDSIVSAIKESLGYDVSEDSVLSVCKARGIFNNRGVETGNAYMPAGIGDKKKEIASDFLRMFASDDFAKLYQETANCVSPYSTSADSSYEYPFFEGHASIVNHPYAQGIWPLAKGLRANIASLGSMFPIAGSLLHDYAFKSTITEYNDDGEIDASKAGAYAQASETRLQTEYQNVTSNWSRWVNS